MYEKYSNKTSQFRFKYYTLYVDMLCGLECTTSEQSENLIQCIAHYWNLSKRIYIDFDNVITCNQDFLLPIFIFLYDNFKPKILSQKLTLKNHEKFKPLIQQIMCHIKNKEN